MRIKKLLLIICSICFSLALAFGATACKGGNNGETQVPVIGVVLDKAELEIEVDQTYMLNATVMPGNATDKSKSWQSANPSVATVDASGIVKGVSVGQTVITVTASGKSATCSVTVKEKEEVTVPVESVTLNKTATTIKVGASVTLTATVTPSNATD